MRTSGATLQIGGVALVAIFANPPALAVDVDPSMTPTTKFPGGNEPTHGTSWRNWLAAKLVMAASPVPGCAVRTAFKVDRVRLIEPLDVVVP